MLGSRRVENLELQFANGQQPNRPLGTGVHRVVRGSSGRLGFGDSAEGALLAQLCNDRRGLWLQVAQGARGIHVNGRPVRRMAMLRAGDSLYLDGVELLLRGSYQDIDAPPAPSREDAGDPRMVLRGLGGRHHGRSYPLSHPSVLGRARDADIRIDDEAFAEQHVQLERRGDRVLLRSRSAQGEILVNGNRVTDALLAAGDQVVFDSRHRFMLEVPWAGAIAETPVPEPELGAHGDGEPDRAAPGLQAQRWPWLLLAALLLSGMLAGLLLFGAR